ncbi:MAG TPA: DUF2339 domain-containing protein [Edaphobacter sp.]|nr:DUF2339 domain-containing protein [Edaphobacter sp.]
MTSTGGRVVAMGPEDLSPLHEMDEEDTSVAAQLRSLTRRVGQLERQIAELRSQAPLPDETPERVAPPPPPSVPSFHGSEPEEIREVTSSSRPTESLENRLGAQVFNRVGIIALMIGVTWFLKLAVDNQWIGPVGRILVGLVAGAGVVLWSEQFRRKGFAVFSYSLKAVGTGALYLTFWAAQQLYHLLPPAAALAGMILVTAWNAYMAWAQDTELLAVYALAGGFATPLLLSTGTNHEIFLFTYLLAIDVATAALIRKKPWDRLLLGALCATTLYFVLWYVRFYAESAFAPTTIFIALFFAVFVSGGFARPLAEVASASRYGFLRWITPSILLPLGNAAFVSLALYSVMQDSGRHWFLPWLMLILAAVYLVLARLPQPAVLAAIHLSLAVVFLTIAIPLKANGHWITAAWLAEGVGLLWVAARTSASNGASPLLPAPPAEEAVSTLRWLAIGSVALGVVRVVTMSDWYDGAIALTFFNSKFAAAMAAVIALAAFSWIAWGARSTGEVWKRSRFAPWAFAAIQLIAVIISLRETLVARSGVRPYAPLLNSDFWTAMIAAGILSGVAWVSLRVALGEEDLLWAQLSGASIVAINLIFVLAGVREIGSFWPATLSAPESELRRALAISAFLMVYGAILLAVGFWKRSAFVRWQALLLLIFTIGKTFLYDMRNLSQGYRVGSFLGLGVLLMAVSFAYQRDWLALREQSAEHNVQKAGSSQ